MSESGRYRLNHFTRPTVDTVYGRIEILHDDKWGTLCNDDFEQVDADVLCNTLGFDGQAIFDSAGEDRRRWGYEPTWLENTFCTGTEADFAEDCQFRGWRSENCAHSEDIFINCAPAEYEIRDVRTITFENTITVGNTRLSEVVYGEGTATGRAEIFHEAQWGTICDDGFDQVDADVFCKSLGLDGAALAGNAHDHA